jgi:hypothetical protein
MHVLAAILLMSATFPLGLAWLKNRRRTLRHPLLWVWLAWLVWLVVVGGGVFQPALDAPLGRYLALCLTGCAGVAVLGARNPVAAAWHFVVVGLLAVLLLPVAEGFGAPRLNAIYLSFLSAILAVGLLNYLPTTFAPAVLALAMACGIEIAGLVNTTLPEWLTPLGRCLLALTPWLALASQSLRGHAETEFDRTWRSFRDRYGVVWGLRTREQFNRAAANAGWPLILTWGGVKASGEGSAPDPAAVLETLRALLKRFES